MTDVNNFCTLRMSMKQDTYNLKHFSLKSTVNTNAFEFF